MSDEVQKGRPAMQGRNFLTLGAGLTAAALLPRVHLGAQAAPQAASGVWPAAPRPGRLKRRSATSHPSWPS